MKAAMGAADPTKEAAMTTDLSRSEYEPLHTSSQTDHVLAELQLYGYRPFQDDPDPRPLPEAEAIVSAVATIFSLSCSGFLFNLLHPSTRPIFWMQLRGLLPLPLVRPLQPLSPIQLSNPESVAR